jgi:hypothetical protein
LTLDDKEKEKSRGPISRNRIESLSDLIFGLALSVGAISLIASPPAAPGDMNPRIIGFIFNFVILIAVWLQYTMIISRLPIESGIVIFANVILLLLIILQAYLGAGIQYVSPPLPIPANTPLTEYSSQLYAIDLAGMVGILAAMTQILCIEEKHLVPQSYLSRVKMARNLLIFFMVLFLFTALPQTWDWKVGPVPIRFLVWWVPLIGTIYLDVLTFRKPKVNP